MHREQKGIARDESEHLNWPFKLNMVSPDAPFFKNTDMFIVSDCVPFAMKNFHDTVLKKDSSLLVSCPKFDKIESYRDKLKTIIERSEPNSVTVVNMEIPCCNDIFGFVENVIKSTGKDITLHRVIVGTTGEVKLIL
jgi:hypothetical protein